MPNLTHAQLSDAQVRFNTTVTATDQDSCNAFMSYMQSYNVDFDDLAAATHMNRVYLIASLKPALGFMGVTQADLDEAGVKSILTNINFDGGGTLDTPVAPTQDPNGFVIG